MPGSSSPSSWWATTAGQLSNGFFGKPSRARPSDMDRSLSARWGHGVWLGRPRIVAVSPHEVREVRAVARRPFGDRWS
eukprot:9081606-Alexandrium_andersonii.AAC.1